MRGSFFSIVSLFVPQIYSRRSEGGLRTTFRKRVGLSFFGGELFGKEMPKLVSALAFHLSVSPTVTGVGCLFLLEPRASDSKTH